MKDKLMKQALFWHKKDKYIQCDLCPQGCKIFPDKAGVCGVRKNINGKLYTLVYYHPVVPQIDPIEKKPFYHFLKGSSVLSFGTVGCNLRCQHCQNYHISRATPETRQQINDPEFIVETAIKNDCKSIAYTYNEPTIYIELMLDIAKAAKKKGIKNVVVSNGYINEKPLLELCKVIDAFNIDLKGFQKDFYNQICGAELEPVLKTLKIIKEKELHLEITNLIIPGLNDDMKKIEEMCKWIYDNLGEDVPLHFSRFFPYYELSHIEQTPIETLKQAQKIGKKYLKHVYVGNVY